MEYYRFRSGYAKYHDLAMLVGFVGESDTFTPPTKVVVLDEPATTGNVWGLENVDHTLVDVATIKTADMPRPAFVCLSEEGIVWFHNPSRSVEDISDAGLRKTTSRKWGYLRGIAQLGEHLFAWGFMGQVYQRMGPGRWVHFDQGLLDPTGRDFAVYDMCMASDGTYYAVTGMGRSGRIFARRQETSWIEIGNPTGEWLHGAVADERGAIWIAGKNGTLLYGDASRGFSNLSSLEDNQKFLSIALYEGKIWLSTSTSIFVHDGQSISEVHTALSPPLRSANRLQAIDGVLWSFGHDDIARYDGVRWQRFICPATAPFAG